MIDILEIDILELVYPVCAIVNTIWLGLIAYELEKMNNKK